MFLRKDSPRIGSWRVVESAQGGAFWIERFGYGTPYCRKPWWYIAPASKTYGTLAEADAALALLIKGPQVRARYTPEGARL